MGTRICKHCNNAFHNTGGRPAFCPSCQYIHTSCDNCGKPITQKRRTNMNLKHHFCCHPCYGQFRSDHPELYPNPFSNPKIHAKAMKTRKERGTNYSLGKYGADSPAWRGGKTEHYKLVEFQDNRELARQRDNYTCQRCGMTEEECFETFGAPLQVHHIIPWRFSRTHALNNLQTLCNSCHGIQDREFLFLL